MKVELPADQQQVFCASSDGDRQFLDDGTELKMRDVIAAIEFMFKIDS